MVFTTDNRILVKSHFLLKDYNVTRLLAEFPDKNWEKTAEIEKLLRFIVHRKNCCLSSMKNNIIYNFTRYCSYTFKG
jgi:hypothetical protein